MAKPKHAEAAEEWTVEKLQHAVLQDIEPLRSEIEKNRARQQNVVAAEAAVEQARRASALADPRARREARRSMPALKDAVEDARDDVKLAVRELREARRAAFLVVEPVLRAEYARLLPRVMRAFNELQDAAAALVELERVARNFNLPGASDAAQARSPLPIRDLGAQVVAQTERFAVALRRASEALR